MTLRSAERVVHLLERLVDRVGVDGRAAGALVAQRRHCGHPTDQRDGSRRSKRQHAAIVAK